MKIILLSQSYFWANHTSEPIILLSHNFNLKFMRSFILWDIFCYTLSSFFWKFQFHILKSQNYKALLAMKCGLLSYLPDIFSQTGASQWSQFLSHYFTGNRFLASVSWLRYISSFIIEKWNVHLVKCSLNAHLLFSSKLTGLIISEQYIIESKIPTRQLHAQS